MRTTPHVRSSLFVAVAAIAAACSHPPAPSHDPVAAAPGEEHTASAPANATPEANGSAPMRVSLTQTGASSSAGDIVLRARVERFVPMGAPMNVTLRLPAGTTLVRGDASYLLASNAASDVSDREVVIHASPVPTDDVVLVADSHGTSSGVHGEAHYRFGRAEPTGPRPEANGAPLIVNGRNFGRTVPATGPNVVPSGPPATGN